MIRFVPKPIPSPNIPVCGVHLPFFRHSHGGRYQEVAGARAAKWAAWFCLCLDGHRRPEAAFKPSGLPRVVHLSHAGISLALLSNTQSHKRKPVRAEARHGRQVYELDYLSEADDSWANHERDPRCLELPAASIHRRGRGSNYASICDHHVVEMPFRLPKRRPIGSGGECPRLLYARIHINGVVTQTPCIKAMIWQNSNENCSFFSNTCSRPFKDKFGV